MDELIEALKTRLSSPLFGFFCVALLVFNWEAFFYLFVQKGDVLVRLKFFEEHTTTYSLSIWPIFFALVIASLYPWAVLLVAWITAKPVELRDMVQAKSEHRLLLERKKLEEARSSLLANAESELIDRAKRDQELDTFQNEELKEKLKLELERLRAERDSFGGSEKLPTINDQHKDLMDIAGSYRTRAKEANNSLDSASFLDRARELEEEAHKLVLNSAGIGRSVS